MSKREVKQPSEDDEPTPKRKAARDAADLVANFKDEESEMSESEVEIIHINAVVNGDEEDVKPPKKGKRDSQVGRCCFAGRKPEWKWAVRFEEVWIAVRVFKIVEGVENL